jgi:hypothetical protein
MSDQSDRWVMVHRAGNIPEAMILRSLLQSEGIPVLGGVAAETLPGVEFNEEEILTLEGHADDARAMIASHLASAADQNRFQRERDREQPEQDDEPTR